MHQRHLFFSTSGTMLGRLLLPIAVITLLSACGQKGPLTLPQEPAPVAEEQEKMEENSAATATVQSEYDGLL
ncbi:lipoprotein [Alkalimonas collagenimarina]|uniref:Lipoprotein n=1 Tax=Alkalimonas collagenimarina TaxID=400390 RepID=A0ABT9GXD9_9GAMM|nr:lipoprotein [Alkalimonas collagenimarina]MDP4535729.1 lipoprotein [Alkalimonas collagenimarina]